MPRTGTSSPRTDLVAVTLLLPKPMAIALANAARTMQIDRETVVVRSFEVFSFAIAALTGHADHPEYPAPVRF